MKKDYIIPECSIIRTSVEGDTLMAGTTQWDPPVKPGDPIDESGAFEVIGEGGAGDEPEAKSHNIWDTWDE